MEFQKLFLKLFCCPRNWISRIVYVTVCWCRSVFVDVSYVRRNRKILRYFHRHLERRKNVQAVNTFKSFSNPRRGCIVKIVVGSNYRRKRLLRTNGLIRSSNRFFFFSLLILLLLCIFPMWFQAAFRPHASWIKKGRPWDSRKDSFDRNIGAQRRWRHAVPGPTFTHYRRNRPLCGNFTRSNVRKPFKP